MNFSPRVIRFRPYTGGKGPAVGFFDIAIDDTIEITDFSLNKKADGKLYWQSPSRPMMKDGQPVMETSKTNGKEYPKRAEYVRLGSAGKGEERKTTESGWSFYNAILEQATAALNDGGGAPVTRTPRAATVSTTTDAEAGGNDGLPF